MAKIGEDIEFVRNLLNEGRVVSIPTETVYGLAGNALDEGAVLKIFQIKNRPSFDPLIVHIAAIDDLKRFTKDVPDVLSKLGRKFWPGPLTLLLQKKSTIPDLVTSGLDMVAIRIPGHPLTLSLLKKLDFPLAAPSANPFGYISPTSPEHVNNQLGDQIEYILDGGPSSIGLESTIVGMEDGRVTVFRLGGLSIEEIETISGPVNVKAHSTSNPQAPGMLKSHYAPKKKVVLGRISSLIEQYRSEKLGVLCYHSFVQELPREVQYCLTPQNRVEEAAARLFAGLRKLDMLDVDVILAETAPEVGLGRAINDRLKRAAA